MRRAAAALAAALALAGAAPATAGAHGGILLGSAIAGPYRTQVMAAPLVEKGRPPAIDVTVYLSSVDTNTPITDARVRTTVTADGRTVRPRVEEIAGGYEAIVPVKDAFTVGQQRIVVDIAGPRGTGRVAVDPLRKDGGPPVALLAATGVALVALLGVGLRVRRRRLAGDPDADVWPPGEGPAPTARDA
ncbi:hypothetical protein [Patulibacter sp. SYSU D01012]|uniref:hypothetical protein n=1 Tax=Patulibacter sp. SYSU D01012 TaxID=2817381 RepID=UPI001B30657D|nr:hypothetical protein [Patulibacter sp. SYSU D01012]